MSERKPLSKKIRFEVFKRDSFKCQYCGRSSPDVILQVDHIKPVKEGGTNDITNLITSCFDCNQGKKDRLLDDKSVLEKQKRQLDELNERRQQLEMMMEWREGLAEIEEYKVDSVLHKWSDLTGYSANQIGEKDVRKWLKTFDMNMILDCMEISLSQYGVLDKDGEFTQKSIEKTFDYIPRIARNKLKAADKPYLKELYYMRGILKNRLRYYDPNKSLTLLEKAYLHGADLDWLKELCLEAKTWSYFRNSVEQFWKGEEE